MYLRFHMKFSIHPHVLFLNISLPISNEGHMQTPIL